MQDTVQPLFKELSAAKSALAEREDSHKTRAKEVQRLRAENSDLKAKVGSQVRQVSEGLRMLDDAVKKADQATTQYVQLSKRHRALVEEHQETTRRCARFENNLHAHIREVRHMLCAVYVADRWYHREERISNGWRPSKSNCGKLTGSSPSCSRMNLKQLQARLSARPTAAKSSRNTLMGTTRR